MDDDTPIEQDNVGKPDGLTAVEAALLAEAETVRTKPNAYEEYKQKEEAAKKAAEDARKAAAERYKASYAHLPTYDDIADDEWWRKTYETTSQAFSSAPSYSGASSPYPSAYPYSRSHRYPLHYPGMSSDIEDLKGLIGTLAKHTQRVNGIADAVEHIRHDVVDENGILAEICAHLIREAELSRKIEADNAALRAEMHAMKEGIDKLCAVVIATLAPPCDAPQ